MKTDDLEGIKIAFYGGLKNLEEYTDEENRNLAHLVIYFVYKKSEFEKAEQKTN